MLNVSREPGISNYLVGQADALSIMQPSCCRKGKKPQ